VANDDSNLRPARAQLTEPPDADPHVGWCGRGEQVTAPPIPIVVNQLWTTSTDAERPGTGQYGWLVRWHLACSISG